MDIKFKLMRSIKILTSVLTIFFSPLIISNNFAEDEITNDIPSNTITIVTEAIPLDETFVIRDSQNEQDIFILEDSFAIPNINNLYTNIDNIKILGTFAYNAEPEDFDINTIEAMVGVNIKEELTKYKIAYNKSKNIYKISDGSFFVSFNENIDSYSFGAEYNLILQYNFPDSPVYKVNNFFGINDLIKELRQDERVKSVTFNLIDTRNSNR